MRNFHFGTSFLTIKCYGVATNNYVRTQLKQISFFVEENNYYVSSIDCLANLEYHWVKSRHVILKNHNCLAIDPPLLVRDARTCSVNILDASVSQQQNSNFFEVLFTVKTRRSYVRAVEIYAWGRTDTKTILSWTRLKYIKPYLFIYIYICVCVCMCVNIYRI